MRTLGIPSMALAVAMTAAPAAAQAAKQAAAADAIAKLAQTRQYDAALAAYDRHVDASSHLPDAALLGVIARAQLKDFAAGSDAVMAADALEHLAAGSDDAALA